MKELVAKRSKRRGSYKDRKGLQGLDLENSYQALAFKIHNGPSHDLNVIIKTFGDQFDILKYMKGTLNSIEPHEANDILKDLKDRSNETAKDLSKKVGNNYVQFIDMSHNVIFVENQMEEVSSMLNTFHTSVKHLNETKFGFLMHAHKSHHHHHKSHFSSINNIAATATAATTTTTTTNISTNNNTTLNNYQYQNDDKGNNIIDELDEDESDGDDNSDNDLHITKSLEEREMLIYDEETIQILHEQKEKIENTWQQIHNWHDQISQYIYNRQFGEAVDLIINAPNLKHYELRDIFEQEHRDTIYMQEKVYNNLFGYHRLTLRTLLKQQLQAFTKMSNRMNNAFSRNTAYDRDDEIGRSIDMIRTMHHSVGGSGVETRRKELTLHLMRLGYVDEAMNLLLLYKSKQVKKSIREIVMSGDIEKYIKDLCDIFFLQVIRTADEYTSILQELSNLEKFAQAHNHDDTDHWFGYEEPNTGSIVHNDNKEKEKEKMNGLVLVELKNNEERRTGEANLNGKEETALTRWAHIDWLNSVEERKNESLGIHGHGNEKKYDTNEEGESIEKSRNVHMSALTVWICQELNQFIDLFEKQVFVFLEQKYSAIGDCLKVVFQQCHRLDQYGIHASFLLSNKFEAPMTKQIQRLFKDKAKLIRQQIDNDDMISTSKQVAKVRKPMLPTTRKMTTTSRRASYVRISAPDGSIPKSTNDVNTSDAASGSNNATNGKVLSSQKIVVKLTKSGAYFYNIVQSIAADIGEILHAGKYYNDLTRNMCGIVVNEMMALVEFYVSRLERKLVSAGKARLHSIRGLSAEPTDSGSTPRASKLDVPKNKVPSNIKRPSFGFGIGIPLPLETINTSVVQEDIILEDIQQLSLISNIYYVSEDLIDRIVDKLQKLFSRNVESLRILKQREKKIYEDCVERFGVYQGRAMESILEWDEIDYDPDGITRKGFGDKYATLVNFNSNDAKVSEGMKGVVIHLQTLTQKIDHYLGTEAIVFVMEKCLEKFIQGLKIRIPSTLIDLMDYDITISEPSSPTQNDQDNKEKEQEKDKNRYKDKDKDKDKNKEKEKEKEKEILLGIGGLQLLFVEIEYILECMQGYVTVQCRKYFAEFLEEAIKYIKNATNITSVEINERELSRCAKRLAQQQQQQKK